MGNEKTAHEKHADEMNDWVIKRLEAAFEKEKEFRKDKRALKFVAPTVDAVEVVHGRWLYNTDDFTPAHRCSACDYNKPMIAGEGVSQGAMNYCPNCGAKMDAKE